MYRIAAIGLALIVVSCSPPAAESEKTVTASRPPTQSAPTPLPRHKLTGAEINAAVVGNTSYTDGASGSKTEAVYYGTGGRVTVAIKPNFTDTGTYKISSDGVFCSNYPKLRNGVETCQAAYRVDANTIRWLKSDGSTYDETVVAGNPEGL